MSHWEHKIEVLQALKSEILTLSSDENFLLKVESDNPWFIPQFSQYALNSIAREMLDENKLRQWVSRYTFNEIPKKIGIIAAGNIPLVSFHDILCAYMTSHNVDMKLSSKDHYLTAHILDIWKGLDTQWNRRLSYVEQMKDIDKIIATGSNNAHQYFEYYFGKYDNILRRNRTSIAIVPSDISDTELDLLMDDVFLYFGLGCRNVSKLWIETGFDLERIFRASERYSFLFSHTKYMNNYDYQRTLLLLNNTPHLANNFLMLKEDTSIFSPISTLHYQYYQDLNEVSAEITSKTSDIQCVVGRDYIPYGQSQKPSLTDYADGVDTMNFLLS